MEGEYHAFSAQEMIAATPDQLKDKIRAHKTQRRGYREERAAREDKGGDLIIAPQDVRILEGHGSEVFMCAWSPKENLLASG